MIVTHDTAQGKTGEHSGAAAISIAKLQNEGLTDKRFLEQESPPVRTSVIPGWPHPSALRSCQMCDGDGDLSSHFTS